MRFAHRRERATYATCTAALLLSTVGRAVAKDDGLDVRPQYHFGAKIPVTCLNRSM